MFLNNLKFYMKNYDRYNSFQDPPPQKKILGTFFLKKESMYEY